MTISSKLATDFVKRNFGAFRFESQPCWHRLTAYHLRQAYVTVGCADLHLFALDTGSTSCMMMSMPKCLKPTTSTLDEMLSKIERDNMDMSDYLGNNNVMVRVTTNRLLVLEKLMLRSGLLNPTTGFSKTQQALLNERINQLAEVANQNYNNLIIQLNSLTGMVNS